MVGASIVCSPDLHNRRRLAYALSEKGQTLITQFDQLFDQ